MENIQEAEELNPGESLANETGADAPSVDEKSPDDLLAEHIDKVDSQAKEGDGAGQDESSKGKEGSDPGESEGKETEKKPEAPAQDAASGDEPGEQKPEPEAYTPDLTYKHLRETKQMPEELASVIKTKEQEDFYRDLFHKAEGFSFVQEKREKAEAELTEAYQTFDTFMKSAQLGDFKKAWTEAAGLPAPNLKQVLTGFGFTPKDIIQEAYELANQSPEQLKANEVQMEAERKNRELEMRLNQVEQSNQAQLEQQITYEYELMSQDQETGSIIKAFEEKNGQGSFFREVAIRGAQLSQETGKIYGPKAIANEIIDRYNLRNLVGQPAPAQSTSPQGQPAHGNNPTSQPAQGQRKRGEPAVIPAIDSAGGSPGQRAIKTPEDLEKTIREELGTSVSF